MNQLHEFIAVIGVSKEMESLQLKSVQSLFTKRGKPYTG